MHCNGNNGFDSCKRYVFTNGCCNPCQPCGTPNFPPSCPPGPTGPQGMPGPVGPTGPTAPSIYAQHGNCRNHAAFHYLKDN